MTNNTDMTDDAFYHYCPATYVDSIVTDGVLRPSAAGAPANEIPALWFTSRPTYEPTALKLFKMPDGRVRQLGLKEQANRLGLARFVVDAAVAPLTWFDWTRQLGVRRATVKRMQRRAKSAGSAVSLYRATFESVPVETCLAIETWDGKDWQRL